MCLIQKLLKQYQCIVILLNNNGYQQDPRVLYTFVPNKLFGQLLDISPKNFMFLKIFDSEFSYIEVWFIYQYYKLIEIDNKANIPLVIN